MFMFDVVHRAPNECNGEIRTVNILFIKLRCVAWVRLVGPPPLAPATFLMLMTWYPDAVRLCLSVAHPPVLLPHVVCTLRVGLEEEVEAPAAFWGPGDTSAVGWGKNMDGL